MSISKEVNIDVLNEVYVLSAFHGLRSAHPDDQWNDQMTEETEGYLPNSDIYIHGDLTSHDDDDANIHRKMNPVLQAMQRVTGTGGSIESIHQSSNGTNKNNKQVKSNEGQLDHNSLTASDYTTTPVNKSIEDLTSANGCVLNEYEK